MNTNSRAPFGTLSATLCLALALPSCGGAVGEAVRPPDQTATGALGGAAPTTCAGDPKYAKPLIVDLDPDARVDLEASMKKGVVVVAYDCASLRVLSSCKLPESSYEYAGVSRKEQVVQMNSMDDLHANMPINSAKLGAEVKSGRSIDLALVLVGRRSTTLAKVARDELTGSCEGATHFVQTATVGAFSLATGSIGKVAAVAEMFNYGGGASSSSERKAMNKDGSLDECRKSEPDSETPPAECRAPLRIELSPIASAAAVAAAPKAKADKGAKEKEAAAAENPCPEGFVFADGLCTRGQAQAFLCDPKNEDECKTQCDKGSAESCFNYGRLVKRKTSREASLPFHKKACDGGFAEGCAEVGIAMTPDGDEPNVVDLARSALAMLKKACDMGSGNGCDYAGDVLMDKDYKVKDPLAAAKSYDRGCDLGVGMACFSLSTMYFKGDGVPKDNDRGVALLNKACQGGSPDECNDLARVYESGKYDVPKDLAKAMRANRRACELDASYCEFAVKTAQAMSDPKLAFEMAQRGCAGNDEAACLMLGDFYKAGQGATADEGQAKTAWQKACKNGDGDEDACKRLGIKMKE